MFEYDSRSGDLQVLGYATTETGIFSEQGIMNAYPEVAAEESPIEDDDRAKISSFINQCYGGKQSFAQEVVAVGFLSPMETRANNPAKITRNQLQSMKKLQTRRQFIGKKYKPVAMKVRPVFQDLPDKYRIKRKILGDPLANMPALSEKPLPFVPTGRYTAERKEQFDEVHKEEFLW